MASTDLPASEEPDEQRRAAALAEFQRLKSEQRAENQPPLWWGVVLGLVAAGAGLAAGEFVAGLSRSLRSPVLSVGDRVIDHVPTGLRKWAIENLRSNDKTVLIWTIVIVIAVAAMLVGVATVRGRRDIGIGFAAIFAVAGAWAAGVGRSTRLIGVVPSLVAGAVAASVLMVGYRLCHPRPVAPPQSSPSEEPVIPAIDRRRFLTATGGIALGALFVASIGRSLQDRFTSSRARAGVRLRAPDEQLPAPPADPAAQTAKDGLSPLFTPNRDFYRIDTALSFPSVDLDSWRLTVEGMVDRELTFSYGDIAGRELLERDITLSCVSNEVGGDLVGNARWIGCRLDDLLAEAGIQSDADQVMGVSLDGFTAGFPVETLDGRDALVAIGMNGEPLPVAHGFPVRLVVPGLYGYVSAVKWLRRIRLTRFDREQGYWVGPRGWAALAPVKTESRIDRPRGRFKDGTTNIAGVAWAPTRGIDKVEVQVDDDEWMTATLGPSIGANSWRQWWVPWAATAGEHVIRVRATDGTGETQTEERVAPAPDGATGWHTIRVNVAAESG
jgi:DMSO/TMAO reductase YedYZ molybdopterin-dependent catalytic subunit